MTKFEQPISVKPKRRKLQNRLFDQVSRRAGKAIVDYNMLANGDKVAIALSGGKDSFALLNILRHRQAFIPVRFDLMAVCVDLGFPNFPTGSIERYLKKMGIAYHIERRDLYSKSYQSGLGCFWCSWNRRKILFQTAQRLGCHKIALGHHLDDIIETLLLNMLFHAQIAAMRPIQELFNGKITLIRPLAYEREDTLAKLVRIEDWPLLDSFHCPYGNRSQRMFVKMLIQQMEKKNPDAAVNIFRSLMNVNPGY